MLTDEQKEQILACVADGVSQRVIADSFGISQQQVSKIVRGRAKRGRHGGDHCSKRYRRALKARAQNKL